MGELDALLPLIEALEAEPHRLRLPPMPDHPLLRRLWGAVAARSGPASGGALGGEGSTAGTADASAKPLPEPAAEADVPAVQLVPGAVGADRTASVLDRAQLDMMRQVIGVGPFLDVMHTFVRHTEAELALLRSAATAGDGTRVARGAHSLRASAAQMGAVALSGIARRIEDAAQGNELAALDALITDAHAALAAVRRQMGTD